MKEKENVSYLCDVKGKRGFESSGCASQHFWFFGGFGNRFRFVSVRLEERRSVKHVACVITQCERVPRNE